MKKKESFLDGAEVFFYKMAIYNINDDNYYKDELKRIMLLKSVISYKDKK